MIWHLYGNNSNDDKVIMADSSDQIIHQYRSFVNDDNAKKTYIHLQIHEHYFLILHRIQPILKRPRKNILLSKRHLHHQHYYH